ncbi:hypothetical protein CUMW_117210 [Citrus unshiu]|nr:hypothetical protein CUMW_117210 [Citrus unshiu]
MDASMEDLARCPGIVERKVKCLYDTFHEPFKPVVSRHPPIPETPSLEDVEPSSVNESALSAAFANYADKMGEKKNSSSQKQETETRIAENRSSILAKEAMAAELTHSLTMHIYRLLCPPHLDDVGGVLAITISMDSLKLHKTIKVYENKPADLIQGQMDTDYLSRLTHALTSVRSVNKTDVVTLGSTFGVKRLYDTFHEPFKRVVSSHPPIPETPSQKDVERSSVNEKEPELTVKSALSTAFAKYADKIGKKKNSSSQVGETSVSDSGAKNSNSGKRDS